MQINKSSKAGKKSDVTVGSIGDTFKSELLKEIEGEEERLLNVNYSKEILKSYEMIENQKLEIEVKYFYKL